MLLSLRSFFREVTRRSGLGAAAALLLAVPTSAQQQQAPRLMYLSCAYAQGTVFYIAGAFSVPANQVGAAKIAFRQYVQTQSGNQATTQACRVAATESSLLAARQSDRAVASTQSNRQAKFVDIGWRYTPTQSATAAPSAFALLTSAPSASAPSPRYRQTGLPSTQTPATSQNTTSQNTITQNTGAYNQRPSSTNSGTGNGTTGTTSSSPGASMAAGVTQAGQSMRDNAMNTGTSITNSATQAATDATTQLQKSAADKITSLFHRQAKPNANQAQQPASASAPANPGDTLLAENKEPASAASARAATSASSGPSFAACHATAGLTEYVSEVFPVMEPDDTKLRYAFWQVVGRQHKAGPVPYSTVACSRTASEQDANTLLAAALDAASKRGVAGDQIIRTGWAYLGQ